MTVLLFSQLARAELAALHKANNSNIDTRTNVANELLLEPRPRILRGKQPEWWGHASLPSLLRVLSTLQGR